jgi:hypothetical protein
MSDVIEQFTPTREQIDTLQKEMSALPPVELPTDHYFHAGMYCRKLFRPAGTLIVGKVHKQDHFFMCAVGEIIAWSEKGMVTLRPGDIIESKAGTKRVTLAVTDSVGVTFHRTDKTTLEEVEEELVEPDETSLYGIGNKLKNGVTSLDEVEKCLLSQQQQ